MPRSCATLLAAQFPRWAALPIDPVPSSGTDNALYRLGSDMVVRLPRIHWAVEQVAKEQRWLAALAPHLPLAIPTPLALGEPDLGYPWQWSVYRWLDGEAVTPASMTDRKRAAIDLAGFLAALQRVDAADGPPPGAHNSNRGEPLAERDASTRRAIAALQGEIDSDAVTAAWEASLQAPPWSGTPVWIHGDLAASNLLAREGRLGAVIDFGCLGVGDPAVDLMIAWEFLAPVRDLLCTTLAVEDATWARGRGWALTTALVALPYYRDTNPALVASARQRIDAVLADHGLRAESDLTTARPEPEIKAAC